MKNNFFSEHGFSIHLPLNWSEYEDDENTNAFFDTKEWTGNLRISVLKYYIDNPEQFLEKRLNELREKNSEKTSFNNGTPCVRYFEKINNDIIYYWYLVIENKLFICSFVIEDEMFNTEKNKLELEKIEKILESIQVLT